jgi:hypothetical protein
MSSLTVTRSPFIRLAHPFGGVLPKNQLAQMTRPIGSTGSHLLAELWPADKAADPAETCEQAGASREADLADLLGTMRDESQDIKTRIEAAEGALRIKDAQSITINIVKFADTRADV